VRIISLSCVGSYDHAIMIRHINKFFFSIIDKFVTSLRNACGQASSRRQCIIVGLRYIITYPYIPPYKICIRTYFHIVLRLLGEYVLSHVNSTFLCSKCIHVYWDDAEVKTSEIHLKHTSRPQWGNSPLPKNRCDFLIRIPPLKKHIHHELSSGIYVLFYLDITREFEWLYL